MCMSCSASAVGSKVIYFGGGGRVSTNRFSVLDIGAALKAATSRPGCGHSSESDLLLSADDMRASVYTPRTFTEELHSSPKATDDGSSSSRCKKATAASDDIDHDASDSCDDSAWDGQSIVPLRPRPRFGAVQVRLGRYLLIYGGYSRRTNEIGDVWCVDLAYGTDNNYANRVYEFNRTQPMLSEPTPEASPSSSPSSSAPPAGTQKKQAAGKHSKDPESVDFKPPRAGWGCKGEWWPVLEGREDPQRDRFYDQDDEDNSDASFGVMDNGMGFFGGGQTRLFAYLLSRVSDAYSRAYSRAYARATAYCSIS
jgi:hypothetical protein